MALSDKKRIQVKIDSHLTEEVDDVLNTLGLSPTAVITALYTRIAANGGIPFDFKMTDQELINQRLRSALNTLPVGSPITTDKGLEEWLDEE
ncbi:MAG: type II toxin-antitoxin system RelB/DinJ family antitoxin [Lactobacillaceae bacterium]|nr:type II toxin-antitoxin system RelB/DinJ family antitoxin [Lactobacillaceae bacterium]